MRPGETLTASLRRSSAISPLRLFAKNGKERKQGFSMTAFAVQIGTKNRKEGRKTSCSILFVVSACDAWRASAGVVTMSSSGGCTSRWGATRGGLDVCSAAYWALEALEFASELLSQSARAFPSKLRGSDGTASGIVLEASGTQRGICNVRC